MRHLSFLLASRIPDLERKSPATQKCPWVQPKEPRKSLSPLVRGAGKGQASKTKNLSDRNHAPPAQHHRSKLWLHSRHASKDQVGRLPLPRGCNSVSYATGGNRGDQGGSWDFHPCRLIMRSLAPCGVPRDKRRRQNFQPPPSERRLFFLLLPGVVSEEASSLPSSDKGTSPSPPCLSPTSCSVSGGHVDSRDSHPHPGGFSRGQVRDLEYF